jgi:hypothetical protein
MHRIRHLTIGFIAALALFGGLVPVTQTAGQTGSDIP